MRTQELIGALPQKEVLGQLGEETKGISYNSRLLNPGELFVALSGTRSDGHLYIPEVFEKGAVGAVGERRVGDFPQILVPDSRTALALLACKWYGNPSQDLWMVGITGTNGKTTTSHLIKSIWEKEGKESGLLGTIGYEISGKYRQDELTTPQSLDLQSILRQMVEQGTERAVMEVSSHALSLKRVLGTNYDLAVFTNLSRDHLDFHRDMDSYFQAKLILFQGLKAGAIALLNLDDPKSDLIRKQTRAKVLTYSLREKADIWAKSYSLQSTGSETVISTPQAEILTKSKLLGKANLYNILAAVGTTLAGGTKLEAIREGVEDLPSVKGRMEVVEGRGFKVLIDYAHTPDALQNLLGSLREIAAGRLILLFGCGGDRDRGKRSLMGQVGSRLADRLILTSDNPRWEEPRRIIEEIAQGVKGELEIIEERREAIRTALKLARKGDWVIVAGKGHETTQLVKDKAIPFDDRKVVEEELKGLWKKSPS